MIIEWMALIAFYAFLAWFFYTNRKKVTRQAGIIFLYKSKFGIKFVEQLAKKFSRFWRGFGYVAIPSGLLGMAFILWALVRQVFRIFANPDVGAGAGIILPGPGTGIYGPFITVSIWYFLLAIGVVVLVHEGAHALVGKAHGLKLKHTGVGLFAVLPLAFVELDEKQLFSAPAKKQISVFAAGPFANLVSGAIFFLIGTFLILPAVAGAIRVDGLTVDPKEGYGAMQAGLQEGDQILSINGETIVIEGILPVPEHFTFPPSALARVAVIAPSFRNILNSVKPGEEVVLETARGSFSVVTSPHPLDQSRAYLGVDVRPHISNSGQISWLLFIHDLIMWIFIFNIGVGLFNLLPLGPLDGGLMAQAAFGKLKNRKLASKLLSTTSMFCLAVVLLNLFGTYIARLFIGS